MFSYRGGQTVRKGVYWKAAVEGKVIIEDYGLLPGKEEEVYFRLPQSYLLIPAVLLALGLPLVLPLRIESSIFIFLVGFSTFAYATAMVLFRLIKRMLGGAATFGYSPTIAYMTGKKAKDGKRYCSHTKDEVDATSHAMPGETGLAQILTTPDERGDNNVHS